MMNKRRFLSWFLVELECRIPIVRYGNIKIEERKRESQFSSGGFFDFEFNLWMCMLDS